LSTGEIIKDRKANLPWTQFAFPPLWHYDVLRALDYLRAACVPPDARIDESVAIVRERRQGDGRWSLDVRHKGTLHEEMSGLVGAPNHWITLRALRVLDWHAAQTKKAMGARRPNQLPDPTSPSVTPAAGAAGAPSVAADH